METTSLSGKADAGERDGVTTSGPPGPFAVLVMAYGAPERLEDVEAYLRDVRGGRDTAPELVAELRERYATIGGRSPLRIHTEGQAGALAARLGGRIPVFVGMRHWHPYIADTLAAIEASGHRRVVAVAMAPHYSRLSIGAYRRSLDQAGRALDIAMVTEWYDHPVFLDAVARGLEETLAALGPTELPATVLFTAHSLPQKILGEDDPYVEQLQASVAGVLARTGPVPARFAFQSAGRSQEPWLGPDAATIIDEVAKSGTRTVILCPIGFVSDHLEVLYDIDVEYRARAETAGLYLVRTPSLNANPLLIEALADVVSTAATRRGWVACG